MAGAIAGTEGGRDLWKMGEGIGRESKEAKGVMLRYEDIQKICNEGRKAGKQ